jgi:hypothetical protein
MNEIKNFIKRKKLFIIISIVFLILIFLVFYFYQLTFIAKEKARQLEKELQLFKALPAPTVPTAEHFTPGIVGEPEEQIGDKGEVPGLEETPLPIMIFNTSGIIQEVHNNRITVMGDGTNFADQQPRQLILLFTLETNVFLTDRTQYFGLDGLKHLKPGMQILINSVENIRGRTEFRVLNINVLE